MEPHELRTHVWVGDRPLDLQALTLAVADDRAGAAIVFSGTVRNHAPGKSNVTHLEYEAYGETVVAKIGEICEEARSKWDVMHIAVEHRTGTVTVGEPSVMVAVSSAHRHDSFETARFVIDELKHRAPIWKKEYSDEGVDWVQGA